VRLIRNLPPSPTLTAVATLNRYGKGTGFEDSTAILKVSDMLQSGRALEVLDEGEEVPGFWNTLGGWAEYFCDQQFLQKYREKPRLFCFSNQTGAWERPHHHRSHIIKPRRSSHLLPPGRFAVSEVYEFFQTDLNLANVYLLDTYHEVYLWLGKSASESQYKEVLEFANRYVREMATRRKIYVPLIATEDGEEPVEFTRHFHTWVTKAPFIDPAIAREERYADLMFQVSPHHHVRRRGPEGGLTFIALARAHIGLQEEGAGEGQGEGTAVGTGQAPEIPPED